MNAVHMNPQQTERGNQIKLNVKKIPTKYWLLYKSNKETVTIIYTNTHNH